MECLLGEQSVCSPSARFFGEIPKKPCTLNKSKRPPTVDIAGFLICSADIYYTCTKEILAGLGQLYVADERFKTNIDKNGNGTAEFVSKAIEIYYR